MVHKNYRLECTSVRVLFEKIGQTVDGNSNFYFIIHLQLHHISMSKSQYVFYPLTI